MTYRVGTELELLAPVGMSRATLAHEVARVIGGTVVAGWHLDTEPSAHRSIEVFQHLTAAFDVLDGNGERYLRVVHDVTIHSDLNVKAPAVDGWYRVVSDDRRILRMVEPFLPATGLGDDDISAVAGRFALGHETRNGMTRFFDSSGASVAMITGDRGEKQRVAECISPPLVDDHGQWVEVVVGTADRLGFTVPAEGATHFHYDAELFAQPEAFARLVTTFGHDLDSIRRAVGTNPNCRRLGPLPQSLVDLVEDPAYDRLTWDEVAAKARTIDGVTKFADVNVLNLVAQQPKLPTVEFRMLPASIDPARLAALRTAVDGIVDGLL